MKALFVLIVHLVVFGAIWFSFEKRKVENEHQALVIEEEPIVSESQTREVVSPLEGLLGGTPGGTATSNGLSGFGSGAGIGAVVEAQQKRGGVSNDQLAGIREQLNAIEATLKKSGQVGNQEALSTRDILNMVGNGSTSEESIEARKRMEQEMRKLLGGLSK